MFLQSLLPQLPSNTTDLLIFITSIIGVILVIYSQFVEAENRRDLIRMIGALCLLVYSLSIFDLVFMALSLGIFFASLVEFIELFLGYHKHIRQTKEEVFDYIKKNK